jgi:hypothetical protein
MPWPKSLKIINGGDVRSPSGETAKLFGCLLPALTPCAKHQPFTKPGSRRDKAQLPSWTHGPTAHDIRGNPIEFRRVQGIMATAHEKIAKRFGVSLKRRIEGGPASTGRNRNAANGASDGPIRSKTLRQLPINQCFHFALFLMVPPETSPYRAVVGPSLTRSVHVVKKKANYDYVD